MNPKIVFPKRLQLIQFLLTIASLFVPLCDSLEAKANPNLAEELDLDPALIEKSPVLQRWGTEVPDLLEEIRSDPSFKTQFQFGYVQYPSSHNIGGWQVGIEDIFFGKSGITASFGYSKSFNHDRAHVKSDISYFLFPLGHYFNLAPVMGYHHLKTETYTEDGLNLGLQLRWVLSRTGAADIRLTQSFISPTAETEVGLTNLTVGYSITKQLRLGVEIEKQNARQGKDSRVGILTQWQLP